MKRLAMSLLLFASLSACVTAPRRVEVAWSQAPNDRGMYPLDGERRKFSGRLRCPKVQLLEYPGVVVPYHKPVRVNPFFRERLQRFEEVVRDVAIEVYGRAPSAIRHVGAYNCRPIRGRKKMSEHGLGNAIDVTGFLFDPDPNVPGPWGEAFTVSVKKHWWSSEGPAATHAKFLHALTRAIARRPDIFRGMLVPPASGHHDHFHLDVGKWRYITTEVWESR